jgi:flagellar basal-body rod protein FlgG
MMRSLWTAATGMVAQQMNIDVRANNLANVNTYGFKKSRAEFEDLMYETMRIAGTMTEGGNQLPTGMQVGMGVKPVTVHKFFTQGDFENTGNTLDIAIEGDGFFRVDMNGTDAYTRAGAFSLDSDGRIVNANGYALQPEFIVPAEAVNVVIAEDGTISAVDSEGAELAGGNITTFNFINPAGLNAVGRNVYLETEASGDPVEGTPGEDNFGTLTQAISTSDSMLQTAINLKR